MPCEWLGIKPQLTNSLEEMPLRHGFKEIAPPKPKLPTLNLSSISSQQPAAELKSQYNPHFTMTAASGFESIKARTFKVKKDTSVLRPAGQVVESGPIRKVVDEDGKERLVRRIVVKKKKKKKKLKMLSDPFDKVN